MGWSIGGAGWRRATGGVALALAALAGSHDSVRAQALADSAGTMLSPPYGLTLAAVDGLAMWTKAAAGDLRADPGETIEITPSRNTVTITRNTGVCDRTEQVRDAIVAAVPEVTDCADVTDTHLAAITMLNLRSGSIMALAAGDFAGLTSLEWLWLDENQLTSLPDGVFAGLTSLETLHLDENRLTSLPDGVFAGLASLKRLYLRGNQLTSLPDDVFAGLTSLEWLWLYGNQLTSLPDGIFAGLTSLEWLLLGDNQLTSLPDGVFAGLTSLERLVLDGNQLTSLPDGVFAGLTSLEALWLSKNQLTSLPDGVFAGLTSLGTLGLTQNRLTSLPDGVFAGLASLETLVLYRNQLSTLSADVFAGLTSLETLVLHGNRLTSLPDGVFAGLASLVTLNLRWNATDPLPLVVTLEKVGESRFKAVAPTGAPFEFVLPVSAANGSIEGDSTAIRIPAGAVESVSLGVTRAAGTTAAVTVDIDSLPGLPSDHSGYALRKSESLPLEVVPKVLKPGVTLTVSPDQVGEGDGATALTVTATLNGGAFTADTAVALAVRALTADTTDFSAGTATLTISAGDTTGTAELTLTPAGDDVDEDDETAAVEGMVAGLDVTAGTVTITDDDTRGVYVSETALAVSEGDSATYTVALESAPAGTVTIGVSVTGDSDVTASPETLAFTAGDWSTAQTVTVRAAADDDAADDTATVSHAVSGGDYGANDVAADPVAVTVVDDETAATGVTLTVSPDQVGEGDGATALTVTATLNGGAFTADTAVALAVRALTADTTDFSAGTATLTISAGDTSGTAELTLTPAGDDVDEDDETVAAEGTVPGLEVTAGTVTITDDDTRGVYVSETALAVSEGDSATYTVALESAPAGTVTIGVSVTGDSDVTASPETLAFTAGDWSTAQTVTVRAAADDDAADDTATVSHAVSGGDYGANDVAADPVAVTVVDDETAATGVTLTVSPDQVGEGDGATALTVTATLNGGAFTADTAVALAVRALTADTTDFSAGTATLTILAGDTTGTAELTLTPAGDDVDEDDETAAVEGMVAGLDVTAGTVTITDDDTRGVDVSETALAVSEGDSATYTVALESAPAGTVTIGVSVTGDSDVTASPETLAFTAGDWSTAQTVTVRAAADDDAADDTATVSHAVSGGDYGANDVAADPVAVTVVDDETAATGVTLTVSPDQVGEGDGATALTVTATLNGGAFTADTAVALAVRALTADTTDFSAGTATLTILAGDTSGTAELTLTPAGDDVDEDDETVAAEGTVTGLEVTAGTVTITDDDTRGVDVSETALAVSEGDSATYTVALESAPAGTVTIGVSVTGDSDVTASPETLAFTAGDWSTAQTVTVGAAGDDDAADDTATVSHAVSGGDYGANDVAADPVAVTVGDDDVGNHPATGRPDILGHAFVGDTLTAVTDSIADADGLGVFAYRWWANDTLVAGATKAKYELTEAEQDKKIKVSVSFTDGQGNAEGPLFSVSVGPVTGVPDAPSGLMAEAGDSEVILNWTAPGNLPDVNPYNGGSKVIRHEVSVDSGSWRVIPRSGEGGENEESYVVTELRNGRKYGFQVRAVNAVGPSEASREVSMTPGLGICGRTPQVRDAIMYWLSDVDGCASVTADDLASITKALYLDRLNITALRRGDFDGLTSVPALEMADNQLSSLPAGIFDDLESLTTLILGRNRLSSLRQDVFDNLAALTKLELRENRLSSLPPGVFDELLALEYLDLCDNKLASFPFDAINALPALSFLSLAVNPVWVAKVVVKPTALTISRGDSATYRMRLNTFPMPKTRIDPAADSTDVTVSPASVTFAWSDWFRYKDVTVSVADSATASSATVTHTAISYGKPGMEIPSVAITIPASERAPATPPTAEIADTETPEAGGAAAFAVTLDRAADSEVTVPYATSHGTAAGEDYEPVTGELVFARGETRGTITVPVLDDDLHEPPETFTVTLGEPDNATLAEDGATATATILDDDPSPATKAWLARFGRTVANQVLDGLGERMLASSRQPRHVTVAGYRLGTATIAADLADHARNHFKNSFNASLRPRKQAGTEHDEPGLLDLFTQGLPTGLDRMVSTSSFHLSNVKAQDGGVGGRGGWTAWGRTASSRFAGRDSDLSLNGSVTSGLAGVDYEQGRLLAGLAVSHSRGAGDFGGGGSGAGRPPAPTWKPRSTLTGVHPYLRINLNDRLAAWGLAGYGRGETSGIEGGTETGIGMNMGAFGARGSLLPSGPFGVALRTDALLVGMRADEEAGTMVTEAGTSRLRFILEGSHTATLGSGNPIGTTLEVGARRDGGDAETGMGIEAGGSLRLAGQKHGLKVEVSGRILLAHQDKDFEEWGVGGSVAFSPGTPGRGLSIRMSSSWGETAGGVERMWSQSIAEGLGGGGSGPGHAQPLTAEMDYTIGAVGDGAILTPYANVVLAGASAHDAYRLGWRMRVGQSFNLSLERGFGGDPRNTERNGLALKASLRR